MDTDWVSRRISRLGKATGVKVRTFASGRVKFTSAHDLRRSFGECWAPKVMPVVLKSLMRHESIETTLYYYVGQNAETMADAIWAASERESKTVGTFVGTSQNSPVVSTGEFR